MSKRWFEIINPVSLTITEFKSISDQKVMAQVKITDTEAIEKIMKRIEGLSVAGDLIVKPGPKANYHTLEFISADGQRQAIELINKSIKTPSAGFNSNDPDKIEANLVRDFDNLLHPNYGKSLLKIREIEVAFKDF